MTPEQVEQRIIELIHREPFVPFVIDLTHGHSLAVSHSRLVINGGGAGFIGPDGGLVEVDFKSVRAVRLGSNQTVA